MRDHKAVARRFDIPDSAPLDDWLAALSENVRLAAAGLVAPEVRIEWYYDDQFSEVRGWVPLTDRELAAAERKRQKAAAAAKVRREKDKAKKRAQLERLAREFNVEIRG